MTIIEAVRAYLMQCPLLREGRLNVDYLGEAATEYTVDEVPCSPVVRRYLDGSAQKQYLFVFASRESYGADLLDALQCHGFYEDFAAWVEARSRARILPALDGGRTAQKLEVLTGGYVLQAGTDTARYQVQCRLSYFEKGAR